MSTEFDTLSQSKKEQDAWSQHVKVVNRDEVRRALDWETRHLKNEIELRTQELEALKESVMESDNEALVLGAAPPHSKTNQKSHSSSDTDDSWVVYQGESESTTKVPTQTQIGDAWDTVLGVWNEKEIIEHQLYQLQQEQEGQDNDWQWDETNQCWWQWDYDQQDWVKWFQESS